jgi:glycine cleavage system transcriptional repressor
MTGIGPDRPGLVSGLATLICQHEGNIEDSTMTRLAGQFAIILIASLPTAIPMAIFETAMNAAAHDMDLKLNASLLATADKVVPTAKGEVPGSHAYLVSVAGSDRTGITQKVSGILAAHQANITDLNAHRIEGETGPVYVMVVEFDLPLTQSAPNLEAELMQLGTEMSLDVRFRSIQAIQL